MTRRDALKTALASAVSAVLVPAGSPTPTVLHLTRPLTFSRPGTYYLSRDIRARGLVFRITSPHVVIDCRGHTIHFHDRVLEGSDFCVIRNGIFVMEGRSFDACWS